MSNPSGQRPVELAGNSVPSSINVFSETASIVSTLTSSVVPVAKPDSSVAGREMMESNVLRLRKSGKERTKSSILEGLTVNKLNLDAIALRGREDEIDTLSQSFDRLSNARVSGNSAKELIFIRGHSGVGKSRLARTLRPRVENSDGGILVEGKFDQHLNAPYTAIEQAFGSICREILSTKSRDDLKKAADYIYERLGNDVELLIHLIPDLEEIMSRFVEVGINADLDVGNLSNGSSRLAYAIRTLYQAISLIVFPFVLVFDDLHWADASSLAAINFLISDIDNKWPAMIVGCYRPNEGNIDIPQALQLQQLKSKDKNSGGLQITEIELTNCSTKEVNDIIMDMMSIDVEERTICLAEICQKRTEGNPYYVIEFMTSLYRRGLIQFSLGTLQWVWDDTEVRDKTESTANVVDSIRARMKTLEPELQQILKYASCLGVSFRKSTLEVLWSSVEQRGHSGALASLHNGLDALASDSYFEILGDSSVLRWTHDKVQEAAFVSIAEEPGEFQFSLGTTLLSALTKKDLELELFAVVDLVNAAEKLNRPALAELDLRAAKKAQELSAFHGAASYVKNGINFLGLHAWGSHQDLTLELHSIGALAAIAIGDFGTATTYANEALARKELKVLQTQQFHEIKAWCLASQLNYKGCIDYCLAVLKQLDFKLVRSRKTVAVEALIKLRKILKALKVDMNNNSLQSRSPVTDSRIVSIVRTLRTAQYAAYNTKQFMLHTLIIATLAEMTLKHGVHDGSQSSISAVGAIGSSMSGNFETAGQFSGAAMSMRVGDSQRFQAEAYIMAYALCLPWTRPFRYCYDNLSKGVSIGMRSGENLYGMWSLVNCIQLQYIMGKPLEAIMESIPSALAHMEELAQQDPANVLRAAWQGMINLSSKTLHLSLEGEVFNASTFEADEASMVMCEVRLMEGELLVFADIESAANRAISVGDGFVNQVLGHVMCMPELFHRGVALFAMAIRTRKRKYVTRAKAIRKKIKSWVQNGNPNVLHHATFLDAEYATLNKRYSEAADKYQRAIVIAAKTGQIHDAALFNERYAECLRTKIGNQEESWYRTREAIRFYQEWGAIGKAAQLTSDIERCNLENHTNY